MTSGYLVETITSDGLEHKGFWVDSKSDTAVLHFHGTAGDFYTHKFIDVESERLAKEGISFLTANNRGHDVYADIRKHIKGNVSWTQLGGGFEKFEDCVIDIASWMDFLAKQGIKRVILQGHSLSQKNLYYQHIKHDPRVIGQIHLSPQNDAGLMYYALGKEKYEKTNQMIADMIKEGRGQELLPKELSPVSYETSAQMYAGYLTEEAVGTLSPYHSPNSSNWNVLGETTDPLLVIFGGADVYMKPSVIEAARLWKEKAKSAKSISVNVIDGASHSYVGFEEQLMDYMQHWINTLVK